MNPHADHPTSLISLSKSIVVNKTLIYQMAKREVLGRYKGSSLGLLWSIITPLMMLCAYTFVFAGVFKAKWATQTSDSKAEFAIILFVGLIVYSLFAEVINKSSSLITSNTNYVTKVIFPLETLAVSSLLSSLFNMLVSFVVLFLALLVVHGSIPWTSVFIPVVILPLMVLILGVSWFFASIGTFVRDVGQTVSIITTVMMFLAPIFFSVSSLSKEVQPLIMLNPLTFIIEQAREVMIFGHLPDFIGLLKYLAISIIIAWLGYAWFQKTRKGFADVL